MIGFSLDLTLFYNFVGMSGLEPPAFPTSFGTIKPTDVKFSINFLLFILFIYSSNLIASDFSENSFEKTIAQGLPRFVYLLLPLLWEINL